MLYVFFGKDEIEVRNEAWKCVHTRTKSPESVMRVSADTYADGMFAEYAESSSLFGTEEVVVVEAFTSKDDFAEALDNARELMANSANHFVLMCGALTAPERKKYEKYAEKVTDVGGSAKAAFNTFALSDALLARDKRKLWIGIMQARTEGVRAEAVIGTLFWQIKILRLVLKTNSPDEAGQKPFVYNKAKRALTLYKEGEIDELSRALVDVYHQGHGGIADTDALLEQWVLKI